MYLIFFLFWVILNGKWTLEIVLFGMVIAAAVYWFCCKFMDFSLEKDKRMCRCSLMILRYMGLLLVEIFKANIQTTGIILNAKRKNEPLLVRFKAPLKTKTARVILANSITLTPGTITVSLEGDEYVVHCLDKSMAEGLESSAFIKLLKKMEEVR